MKLKEFSNYDVIWSHKRHTLYVTNRERISHFVSHLFEKIIMPTHLFFEEKPFLDILCNTDCSTVPLSERTLHPNIVPLSVQIVVKMKTLITFNVYMD